MAQFRWEDDCRNVRTVFYSLMKVKQQLRPIKDPLGLKVPGVYKVTCDCGASYVGQMGRLMSVRVTEHKCHVKPGQWTNR